jgi:hypothetical protein
LPDERVVVTHPWMVTTCPATAGISSMRRVFGSMPET